MLFCESRAVEVGANPPPVTVLKIKVRENSISVCPLKYKKKTRINA
jgi:hypothetical protein